MDELLSKELEEKLREAASIGDVEMLRNLVELKNVDFGHVRIGNPASRKTALHWGAKRNHQTIVQYLLSHGADKEAVDNDGKTAAQLTSNAEVHSLLGESGDVVKQETLPITPNYLAHPPFPYSTKSEQSPSTTVGASEDRISQPVTMNNHSSAPCDDELVLKVRVAYTDDPDFIEVELPRVHLRYEALLNLMCAELGVDKQLVARIRKLPNTILRKDKDVGRLQDFQELELILTNRATSSSSRGYRGIVTSPNMTNEQILY